MYFKFQKYHFNFQELGIIGKLVKSSVRYCRNRPDVPFVVLGHIYYEYDENIVTQ